MSNSTSGEPPNVRHSVRLREHGKSPSISIHLPQIVSNVPDSSYQRHSSRSHQPVSHKHLTNLRHFAQGRSRSHTTTAKNSSNPNHRSSSHIVSSAEDQLMPLIDEDMRENSTTVDCVENLFTFGIARQPVADNLLPHDVGYMNIECSFCHALHWLAEATEATQTGNRTPAFPTCCAHGKVILSLLEIPPPPLYMLYTGTTIQAKEFREHIVQYNSALAFTSMGVNIDRSILGRGPPVFRIHGELKHLAGALQPLQNQNPSYAQLYIYDPQSALSYRMSRNANLRRDTMDLLQNTLAATNAYAPLYQHTFEVLDSFGGKDYTAMLCVLPNNDPRRYNLPTADEVGVILPTNSSFQGDYRDIKIYLRPQISQDPTTGNEKVLYENISECHAAYAPLHYVLLFPYGQAGWYQGMRIPNNPRQITLLQYSAFRIHSRQNEFSTILRGGRLFQHYLVDMFACIDQQRLRFLRFQQPTMRVALINGIKDALTNNDSNVDLSKIGERIILPSSYIGGPRELHQRYQDGMAIARHFKKIDLFLTMTANPAWPEITRELLPGQTAANRPDLVSRVFQLKKKALLDAITKHGIFGPCVAHIYVIEFQKRGLPHVHILIFLKDEYKVVSPEIIDSIISAAWPDPETQPNLFEHVKKFMVHGPCGVVNPHAPCMKDGKCTEGFPKPFSERTTMDSDSYPKYFRPDDGRAYMVRGVMCDNRWIIPFPAFCVLTFNCHVNIECAIQFGSVKYIFKYFTKGGDRGTLSIHNANDEVKEYIDGRYFSASEAAWRIFQFLLHGRRPNVIRLQIHLPNQQSVIYNEHQNAYEVLNQASNADTSLTAFFKANNDDGLLGQMARQYTYQEFPQHFTLKTDPNRRSIKYWAIRQRQHGLEALGRMTYVGPTAGERFFLRVLLTVTKGPQSFEDLKNVDGVQYDTFQAACIARGLLEDDNEWEICLQDAAAVQPGIQLRHLFATILLFCGPTAPGALWQTFRSQICDDLRYQLHRLGYTTATDEDTFDYGLYLLDDILHDSGHSLSDFAPAMPLCHIDWDSKIQNRLLMEQANYNVTTEKALADEYLPSLNDDQRKGFDDIWDSIHNQHGHTFFIDGFGGTGKTYLYQTACHAVRAEGRIIICVASTGLACLLLPGGRTAHSTFKIPIDDLDAYSMCHIPKQSRRADLLRRTHAIIYDECLMTHRYAFEALDRTLQDIRDCEKPFGGITVIFGGDFQQILPVVPSGSRAETVDACIKNSYLWDQIHIIKLRHNMRLLNSKEDEWFANWLLNIGHGRNLDSNGNVEIPERLVTYSSLDLVNKIYGKVSSLPESPIDAGNFFLERAILAPRNSDVYDLNEEILGDMRGEEIVYESADSVENDESGDISIQDHIPLEYLQSLNPPDLPPAMLKMKIGCPLILLRNLDPSQGLCNGTRLILCRTYSRVLEVMILGGDHHEQRAFIPRIILKPSQNLFPFILRRRQFPVRLCFAMTINKAEGQSLNVVGIHLIQQVFSHGQLYVALSRARSSKNVYVLLPETEEGRKRRTANIVYPEVLLD